MSGPHRQFQLIAPDVKLGKGVRIFGFTNLYGCEIGDDAKIGTFVEIQKGVKVGNRCKISSHTFICEGVTLEEEVFIGHNVTFINDLYPRATNESGRLQTEADWKCVPTLVKKGASIGSGATLLCGITVGEYSIIGAGSVVTRDVPDCAALLQTIAVHDPCDSTSAPMKAPDYLAELEGGVRGMKLGLPREYFELPGMDPEVRASVEAATRALEKLGAELVPVSLPHTKYALATYYLVAPAEASSNLARYDGVRYGLRAEGAGNLLAMYGRTRDQGFGLEVKRRVMLGTYALSAGYYDAYYLKAQKVRTLIKQDFTDAFRTVDAVLAPTSPTPAFRIGEKVSDPLAMYLNDVFTLPCNLAGLPGLSVPCGFTKASLPIGLQVLGRPWDEARVLRIGRAFEREHDFHRRTPPLRAA